MFSQRYNRQLLMRDIGENGQSRLLSSHVAVVGAGGLGYPILTYLAAAGVGRLTVVDHDVVSLSNLNRQLFYDEGDLGHSKATLAAASLRKLNPETEVEAKPYCLDADSVDKCLRGATLIIDAVDNIAARRIVNSWANTSSTPVMFSAVEGWSASLMFYQPTNPDSPCYECVFPIDPHPAEVVPIIGATAGVLGTLQAARALRYLLGLPVPSTSLTLFNVKHERLRTVVAHPRFNCQCQDVRRSEASVPQ